MSALHPTATKLLHHDNRRAEPDVDIRLAQTMPA